METIPNPIIDKVRKLAGDPEAIAKRAPIWRLRQVFKYDPETGVVTWAQKIAPKVVVGRRAGTVKNPLYGYRHVRAFGHAYSEHVLVWALWYGEWPAHDIDHIDRDTLNNRISNLRLDVKRENQHNRAMQRGNTSGFTGVVFDKQKGRWRANICVRSKRHFLGYFDTPEAASAAYQAKKSEVHPFATLDKSPVGTV